MADTAQETSSQGDILWQALDRFNTVVDQVYEATTRACTHFRNNEYDVVMQTLEDLPPIMGAIYAALYGMEPGTLQGRFEELAKAILDDLTILLGYIQSASGEGNMKTALWQENKTKIYPTVTRIRTTMGAAGLMTFQATAPKPN